MGVPGCPSGARAPLVGWGGTTAVERPWFAVEKSADAVVPAGIVDRWEGLNAKPRCRTLVLVGSTLKAANPVWGLGGRVRR